jgi:hypothetical protein
MKEYVFPGKESHSVDGLTSLGIQKLIKGIREMKPYHRLYKILKGELKAQGHWKDKKRWSPPKDYFTKRLKPPTEGTK